MFQSEGLVGAKFGVGAEDVFWIENSFDFLIERLFFFGEVFVRDDGFDATFRITASACAAVAISRFPLPLHPPRLEEVQALISHQSR